MQFLLYFYSNNNVQTCMFIYIYINLMFSRQNKNSALSHFLKQVALFRYIIKKYLHVTKHQYFNCNNLVACIIDKHFEIVLFTQSTALINSTISHRHQIFIQNVIVQMRCHQVDDAVLISISKHLQFPLNCCIFLRCWAYSSSCSSLDPQNFFGVLCVLGDLADCVDVGASVLNHPLKFSMPTF